MAKEYAPERDRLAVFKSAAALQGLTPKQALAGMMAKHTTSIYVMCEKDETDPTKWDEKITDHINYLALLAGLVEEEAHDSNGNRKNL